MPALTTEQVLLSEARTIHGDENVRKFLSDESIHRIESGARLEAETTKGLYRALNALDSAALCLSGGGIRSAAFALGVIQSLASHPRPLDADQVQKNKIVGSAENSLLARFHYLSTVSGGGYIGSWLSTWIARTGFGGVWEKLTARQPRPEDEAQPVTWLRAYSNFLTPKLGITSADTWTTVALYVRNLVLNWLVVAPVLCAAILAIKLVLIAAYRLANVEALAAAVLLAAAGIGLQIWALRFALLNRPSRPSHDPEPPPAATSASLQAPAEEGAKKDREASAASQRGADQSEFLRRCLVPAVAAALFLTLALLPKSTDPLFEWLLWRLASTGATLGIAIYALAWLAAWPWPKCDSRRGRSFWAQDLFLWSLAGAVYGVVIAVGLALFGTYQLEFLVSKLGLADATALLLLIFGVPWIFTAQLAAEMLFVGLSSGQPYSDADREWFARSAGWVGVAALSWLLIASLVLIGADLIFQLYADADRIFGKTAGGLVSALTAVLTAVLGKSSASPAKHKAETTKAHWTNIALAVTTPIFLAALIMGLSALLDRLLLNYSLLRSPLMVVTPADSPGMPREAWDDLAWLAGGFLIAVAVAALASKYVNVNRFSLHALYRNRLIRAFLGATNPDRRPNAFTGFDEGDNPRMESLWREGARGPGQPFHVINIALNVVSSERLAWQERKAESFTASPLHAGTAYKGFRACGEYGDGMSVGTAMAISGAAASPNMGYHSSPLVTLLLALFNVRLGWWLGNPGKEGEDTYRNDGPTTAIKPLIDETFGLTTDRNPYVYLSDGGHFENLGLYEMVRRRCRFIVVSDAGCDKAFQFEDLGNAVRKIWLDLGVPISFRGLNALRYRAKKNTPHEPAHLPPFHAVGTIDYPAADGGTSRPGIILYIKPCFHRNRIVNVGVRNYAALNADFPHESTSDQFFSESQFESYRALGFEMMDDVLNQLLEHAKLPPNAGLDTLFEKLPRTAATGP